MSGRLTPVSSLFTPTTSEYSASETPTSTSNNDIGTFILRVTCNNPSFDKNFLVVADEEMGIVDSVAEFEETICKTAEQACGYGSDKYSILQIRLPISDKYMVVTARQLFSIIWRLPRTPGLVKPNLVPTIPDSNRIDVILSRTRIS